MMTTGEDLARVEKVVFPPLAVIRCWPWLISCSSHRIVSWGVSPGLAGFGWMSQDQSVIAERGNNAPALVRRIEWKK